MSVVPVLCLLLSDQFVKLQASQQDIKVEKQKVITRVLNIIIIVLIVIGSLHYQYLQKLEYGDKFSLYKFFLGFNKCSERPPDYLEMMRQKAEKKPRISSDR